MIANDLAFPDLSAVGVAKPVAVSIASRMCTADKVGALKRVLASHPGTSDVHLNVHLRLITGDTVKTLRLDDSLRVTSSSALMGDLKALLGHGCLAN